MHAQGGDKACMRMAGASSAWGDGRGLRLLKVPGEPRQEGGEGAHGTRTRAMRGVHAAAHGGKGATCAWGEARMAHVVSGVAARAVGIFS